MVMEQIIVVIMDLGQNLVYGLLLTIELKTLVPSWAISNIVAHHASAPALDKLVVFDQI